MRILLDDQPCSVDASTVGEAIDAAAAIAAECGRMIVEIEVDGSLWGREQLDQPEQRDRDACELRLASADAAELIGQAIADADAALRIVDDAQRAAATCIESGESVEAMQQLAEALRTWESIREAVVLIATTLDRAIDAAVAEKLETQLRLIRDALQAKDPIGLSDILLYEMPAVVQVWRDALDTYRVAATEGDRA